MKSNLEKKSILSFFFLLLLVLSIKCDVHEYNETITTGKTDVKQLIEIDCSKSTSNKAYTKIMVNQTAEVHKNILISVFSDEDRTNRIQMDHGLFGQPKVWVHTNQKKNNKIITTVECETAPCEFNLLLVSEDEISLHAGEQMNYYVNPENTNTKFKFTTGTHGNKMNIWAKGGNKLETKLDAEGKTHKNFYLFDATKDSYTLEVNAEEGDFVNVGSLLFDDKGKSLEEIVVDESPVSIYLSKDFLNKACLGLNSRATESPWVYGSGIIDTTIARGYLEEENGVEVPDTRQDFNYGSINMFFNSSDIDHQRVCFDIPENYPNVTEIILTFQLISGDTIGGFNVFQPQQNGVLYPRFLNRGQIAAFIGQFPGQNYKEISYNMLTIYGFPKMYVIECENYPLCSNVEEASIIFPHNINKMSSYSIYKNETTGKYSPVNYTQQLLVVMCDDTFEEGESVYDDVCIFGTLFYSELNPITLIENQYFNQHLLKGDTDTFKIDFYGQNHVKQIYVDINVFSGSVKTNVNNITDGNTYKEYYNANKIYFVVDLNEPRTKHEIEFKVTGVKNAFYTIQYSYVRDEDDSSKKNALDPGVTYLITVNPKKDKGKDDAQKIISYTKDKSYSDYPFLVNFHSLNCKLEIYAVNNETQTKVETYDYFSQDLIDNNQTQEDKSTVESYDYKINVIEEDFSDYENKRCMVFTSALEIVKEKDEEKKDEEGEKTEKADIKNEILVGEDTVHQIMFKTVLNKIRYVYPDADQNNDLFLLFNLIDKAKYTVKLYFENYDNGHSRSFQVFKNKNYKLNATVIRENCPYIDEICNIIIEINLDDRLGEPEPMLEFQIKSIGSNGVTFLQKNNMKNGFLMEGTNQYYFTEVGKSEEGSVTINFLRGDGKIAAKLVDLNTTILESAENWNEKYDFPTSEESINYDPYLKKCYYITEENQCTKGCYLLIRLYSDIENEKNQGRVFPFSIMVHAASSQRSYQDIQIMSIKPDYYIIGNLGHSDGEFITELYDVWIGKDASAVEIDFQSDAAGIFINVGESKPTTRSADFQFFPRGKDFYISISKDEIIRKGKARGVNFHEIGNVTDIRHTSLTLGIWTNTTDTVYTTVYSFLVHLASPNDTDDDLDIHHVNSDQKSVCSPKKVDNNSEYPYRCLYMIETEEYNAFSNLLVYANVQDNSVPHRIYANDIQSKSYELENKEELLKNLPTSDKHKYTTYRKEDYIYTTDVLFGKYLFVSVETKNKTVVELMTTHYAGDLKVTPNPSTPQLFVVGQNPLNLKLQSRDMYIMNLVSLEGEAEIYWEKDNQTKFYLRGRDDQLSLPSIPNSDLVIKNLNVAKNTSTEISNFAFYLTYNVRFAGNLDEFSVGKSVSFGYTNTRFPLKFYAKLPDLNKAINVFFTFYDIKAEHPGFLTNNEMRIRAAILDSEKIYAMRSNGDIRIEHLAGGNYDPGLKTGFIHFSVERIQRYNITKEKFPYLYVEIEGDNRHYSLINVEITANQQSSLVPTTEKVFQYGSLQNDTVSIYKLRPNYLKSLMRIEFSSTTKDINFTLSKTPNSTKNEFDFNGNFINGRYIFDIDAKPNETDYLYMNIRKNGTDRIIVTNRTNGTSFRVSDNYAFKYINYATPGLLKDYHVENSKIEYKKSEPNATITLYDVSFNPIPESEKLNVTYIVKFASSRRNNLVETIALTLGGNYVIEVDNPPIKNNKINVEVPEFNHGSWRPGARTNHRYIEVYAIIKDKSVTEVVAYKPVELAVPKDSSNSDKSTDSNFGLYNVLVTIIAIVLLIFLLGFIYFFCVTKKKNQDLLNRVNQVSFQEEDRNDKTGGLLYSDEQNALS